MTTRSIILHAHEIRAAMAGTLGLIVRPVKPQPSNGLKWNAVVLNGYGGWTDEHGKPFPCPLGVPGGRLVGKEKYARDGRAIWYAADCDKGPTRDVCEYPDGSPLESAWRSPATMPAWASRVTLEVQGVRCVRPAELAEDDARQCGLPPNWCGDLSGWSADDHGFLPANWDRKMEDDYGFWSAKESLESHWTAKYGPRYPWETSWAWAVEVRRMEG